MATPLSHSNSLRHILLVDDEEHISDLLTFNLESEHFLVSVEPQASKVMEHDLTETRLILADAMSQSYTGLDMLHDLKSSPVTAHIPVIIVAHSDTEDDILEAFDAGADDYISKPFSLRELVARIRSVLRRRPIAAVTSSSSLNMVFGPINIDLLSKRVSVDGQHINLTPTEYAIIALLAKNTDHFYSRREIFDQVWRQIGRTENERIVDTNVSRLRKKLGDAGGLIVNKSGYGYTIVRE
ncbi:MAG: response regulator transcription factor [Muribaculaceae bacterium]|nr:response regulator transcription factor [Muribaculaceae bacterium]